MDTLSSLQDFGSAAPRGKNCVHVVVRVRPMNARESMNDTSITFVDEDNDQLEIQTPVSQRSWTFDGCFGPQTRQEEFFENCGVLDLVDAALDGYSATMFAYGQTGAGKTHTMTGCPSIQDGLTDMHGVVPRVAVHIFEQLEQMSEDVEYTVRCSYLEIYNEQVSDLLNPDGGVLNIRWRQSGFFVEDLFVVDVSTVDDILAVFEEGSQNRSVGSHNLNRDSSRSHALMTVYIEAHVQTEDDKYTKYGKLTFVDLAGSENLKKSGTTGTGIKETSAINKSLFALGNVISALSDTKKREGHIAYRDSAITKLLADSLGGNSHCLMVACLSPALQNVEDTLSTLHYAARTRSIQNRPTVQLSEKDQVVHNLRSEITSLQIENKFLRSKLAAYGDSAALVMHGGPDSRQDDLDPSEEMLGSPQPPPARSDYPSSPRTSHASRGGFPNGSLALPDLRSDTAPVGSPRSVMSTLSRGSAEFSGLRARATEEYLRRTLADNRDVKGECVELRRGMAQMSREHQAVVAENEVLLQRLENLENVFHNGTDAESSAAGLDSAERRRSLSVDSLTDQRLGELQEELQQTSEELTASQARERTLEATVLQLKNMLSAEQRVHEERATSRTSVRTSQPPTRHQSRERLRVATEHTMATEHTYGASPVSAGGSVVGAVSKPPVAKRISYVKRAPS